MCTSLRIVFGLSVALVLVGGPWWYADYRHRTYRNFRVVEEGVLYRSGQMTPAGLRRMIHDYGIKTIITLRDGDQDNDRAAEDYLKGVPVKLVRLPHKGWTYAGETYPNEAAVKQFREVAGNPANQPVLIHCFAGVHRTGAYCAIWRMDQQGWTNEQATREMVDLGYDILDKHVDLKAFLHNYRPPLKDTNTLRESAAESHLTPVRVHGGVGP